MKMRRRILKGLVPGVLIALISSAILVFAIEPVASADAPVGTCTTSSDTAVPCDFTRIAVNGPATGDAVTAMGYAPTCYGSPGGVPLTDDPTDLTDSFVAPGAYAQMRAAGTVPINSNPPDLEALANCHPTTIFQWGGVDATIAPTGPNGNFSSGCPVSWCLGSVTAIQKTATAMAGTSGSSDYLNRAMTVAATTDRNIAALEPQLSGHIVAWLGQPGNGSFTVHFGYVDIVNTEKALGLDDVINHMPDSDFPGGRAAVNNNVTLSDELLGDLAPAEAIFSYTGDAKTTQALEDNSLWKALPAVKAGKVFLSPDVDNGGIYEQDWLDSSIATAFKVGLYHALIAGQSGPWTHASATFDPASSKFCWAVSPAPGTQPAGALTLSVGGSTVTLDGSPAYSDPLAGTNTAYETSPETFQATGCVTLSAADAAAFTKSPTSAVLSLAGVGAPLLTGDDDITVPGEGLVTPTVSSQPVAATVSAGSVATFTAEGSTSDPNPQTRATTPAVLWQVSSDGGHTWSSQPGGFTSSTGAASTGTLSFTTSPSDDGKLYRAGFFNNIGVAYSSPVKLSIALSKPAVSKQPKKKKVKAGKKATFSVTASGNPTPTIQWQYRTHKKGKAGKKWHVIAGAHSAKYTTPKVKKSWNGRQYRAVVTNAAGQAVSKAVKLTIKKGR